MSVSVCLRFSRQPFALIFGMVFRNDVGKILKLCRDPMVEYLASYGIIKGDDGGIHDVTIQ